MSDPYKQREEERARDDADDRRRQELERADRLKDHEPMPPACSACGTHAGIYDVGGGPACAWCSAPVKP